MSAKKTSAVKINGYTRPKGELGRSIVIVGIIMALSARKEVISPGSPLYDYVLAGRPSVLKGATWVQNGLFYFLFGAHSIETVIFAYAKLYKHGISFFSLAWWQWMATCFVGGKFCFDHFGKLVAKQV
jgi:hypothetical protein